LLLFGKNIKEKYYYYKIKMFLLIYKFHKKIFPKHINPRFINNSEFLFECINNLTGVYNCDTGMTPWKLQYQNSILDKSDYFLNTQLSATSLYCANFNSNNIIFSEFSPNLTLNNAQLIPVARATLQNFDSTSHYIRSAFGVNLKNPKSKIISLGSDDILRINNSTLNTQNAENKNSIDTNDILGQMQGMYA
jgi:hypothetical protein